MDYLTEQIGLHTEHATSWKLVNLFIGFNDASVSCLPGKSAEQYKANVKNSLIRLFEKVDYVLVNIGMYVIISHQFLFSLKNFVRCL